MAEEIDFENGRNSNFEGLVTLTLTFDRAIRHIVLHHSSTSTYIPNFIQIEETFCGHTDVRTDISPLHIIRSTLESRPNNMKLVHWLLMGGLLYLVQQGDWVGCGPTQSPPRCTKCNSPPINGQCTNHCIAI